MGGKMRMTLYTAPQVGKLLGITPGRVRVIARTRDIGFTIDGWQWAFTNKDIKKMLVRKVGRPVGYSPAKQGGQTRSL